MSSPSVRDVWFPVFLSATWCQGVEHIRCLDSTLLLLSKLLVQVMEDISRRLTKLESATTQATQSVVNESVRSEQSRAETESALAQQRTYQVSLLYHMPLVL